MSAQRSWIAGVSYIQVHVELVRDLDGDFIAAALWERITWRAGTSGGWWTATYADMCEETGMGSKRVQRAAAVLRERGLVESSRVDPHNATLQWRPVFSDNPTLEREDPEPRNRVTPYPKQVDPLPETGFTSLETVRLKPDKPCPDDDGMLPMLVSVPASTSPEDYFEDWWKLYPLKVGKGAARKAYRGAVRKVGAPALMDAVVVQAGILGQKKAQGFCCHASTWLNGERWADDLTAPTGPQTGFGIMMDAYKAVGSQMPGISDGGNW